MPELSLDLVFQAVRGNAFLLTAYGALFFVFEAVIPWLSRRLAEGKTGNWQLQTDIGFFKPQFLLEFSLPLVNKAIELTLFLGPVYALMSILQPVLPNFVLAGWIAQLPFVLQVFAGMLVMDLAVYAEHRFIHRFAWPFHAIHHAAHDVTWITAFRMHPVNTLSIMLFNSVIGWILGFSGEAWVLAATIVGFLSVLEHANLDWDWGVPFRYLIVSPNFHKWHHVKRDDVVAKNLCLAFPFIDLLFGTFHFPRDERPEDFGIYELPGEEPIEGGLLVHLWYPFGRCWRAIVAALSASQPD